MAELMLCALGAVCVLYGFRILAVGSGTMFFAVWFGIATLLFGAAIGIRFGLVEALPAAAKWAGGIAIAAIFAVCVVETGLIATSFSSAGKPELGYIVVLGAQVRPDGPSMVLRHRLDTAASYLRENPKTLCIVTGAQGPNEPCTEAQGMRDYLVGLGIDADRILMEPQAFNTRQNIAFSKRIIGSREAIESASVGVVTNNFHVFRGVRLAKKQGLVDVCGIAAPSNPLYLPNNVLREYFGITKDFLAGSL